MKLPNKFYLKIEKFHNITLLFLILFVSFVAFSVSEIAVAQNDEEVPSSVPYLQLARPNDVVAYTQEQRDAAFLAREVEEDVPIEFVSKYTQFKWFAHNVNFPLSPESFLAKINELKKDKANYNHLIMSLYLFYEEGGDYKLVESPLYASERITGSRLNADGKIEQQAIVRFYTKIEQEPIDRYAYFISGKGMHSGVRGDQTIFPIMIPYNCEDEDCNPVCKRYIHPAENLCSDAYSNCRHTEPHALFHVFQNSTELFAPLIQATPGIGSVKSVGARFFSFYHPCQSCSKVLHQNRKIKLGEDTFKHLSYLFYFDRLYTVPKPVLRIHEESVDLFNNFNSYLFLGYLFNEGISPGPEIDDELDPLHPPRGAIKLSESASLDKKLKIFAIKVFLGVEFTGEHRYRIYYY